MKIKRYMAPSMRAALAEVRAEQGAEAVILSSRRVAEGIEVIAACDYDEALFIGATQKRAPTPPVASAPAPAPTVAARPAVAPPTAVTPPAPPAATVVAAKKAPAPRKPSPPAPAMESAPLAMQVQALPTSLDAGYQLMQRELKDLREMLRGELSQMTWNDKRLREPHKVRVLEQLTAMDIGPDVARSLAANLPRRSTLKNPDNIPLALLVKNLEVVGKLSTVNAGVFALVGPTGAGKTTTIAKLAARWSMQHGSRDLALISTDGYRIGAREQLSTYARILGAQMYTASSGKELAQVLERLKSKKLVLIDTAGMGARDERLSQQLAALRLGAAQARVFLTLPAHGDAHALDEIVASFARISPTACILTKVDEAASLGAVISTALRHRLRIAYLCNGQRVPEDLHAADGRQVWLIKSALKLKQRAPARLPDDYFARHFGATLHA
jgi:flagellar biosynthesis protein FlhF